MEKISDRFKQIRYVISPHKIILKLSCIDRHSDDRQTGSRGNKVQLKNRVGYECIQSSSMHCRLTTVGLSDRTNHID